MEKALLEGGRSGHRYKWSAYRRIEKNEKGFVITGRVDRDTRGVHMTGKRTDKALSKDKSLQWMVNVICGHIQFSLYLVALPESYPKFFNFLL